MPRVLASSWFAPGLLILFLLPALAFAGHAVVDRWYQGYLLTEEEAKIKREVAALREENLRLQSELTLVRSDQYIEAVAREQLNLVKPGDRSIVIIAPPAEPTPVPAARSNPAPAPDKPAWRSLLDTILRR